jgi:hypothetical protein
MRVRFPRVPPARSVARPLWRGAEGAFAFGVGPRRYASEVFTGTADMTPGTHFVFKASVRMQTASSAFSVISSAWRAEARAGWQAPAGCKRVPEPGSCSKRMKPGGRRLWAVVAACTSHPVSPRLVRSGVRAAVGDARRPAFPTADRAPKLGLGPLVSRGACFTVRAFSCAGAQGAPPALARVARGTVTMLWGWSLLPGARA